MASHEAETNPGGSLTSTFTVEASSRSLGTRTDRTVSAPAGTEVGWTVTCACAAAGTASAPAATASAAIRLLVLGSSHRHLQRAGVLVEIRHAVGHGDLPIPGRDELEGVGHVVARA